MDPALTIRSAVAADVPLVLQFIRDLAEYEKLLDTVEATEERVREGLFGAKPVAECLLAFVDDAPTGFALFFTNYSTFLAKPGIFLEDLFVQPAFRRRGIGRALLLHLAKLANARGCGRMDWTVLDWNIPALDFYETLGATVMPQWRVCRLTGAALARLA